MATGSGDTAYDAARAQELSGGKMVSSEMLIPPRESKQDQALDAAIDGMSAAAFAQPGGGLENAATAFDDDDVTGDD